ncbi:Structure-specific endonuclease subunit slx1 [Penicillium taxi]|uniref:Structure-specific endonuclease subunit slx1 n=1 Tax=Penicillium taxi TaxID=168475 RepID=UPI0025459043|nr:Structure-specific endonuclease subunit slx1 [Penicillium taxi]KAJ5908574.1 Structure-specific endonuclease subunit slx1 [Penicillium taxi]
MEAPVNKEESKPIPAYYCCYLLRSTVRHASLYIGSTPNPVRRLAQHNGDAKGGAKRTAKDKLRPWEMTLVVEGFMSRIGALQFEWAWQHPDRSRHFGLEDDTDPKPDSKAAKAKSRGRSRRSLKAHLEDVHSLLRSTLFNSWPLRVRFFSTDVYRVWKLWNERVHASIPLSKIILDGDCIEQGEDDLAVGSIQNICVDYSKIEIYLEKSMFLLEDAEDLHCQTCMGPIKPSSEHIVVCPKTSCRGTNHLRCLSTKFLEASDQIELPIPTRGVCPACKEVVSWPLMMRELCLRIRDEKEVQAILRKKERRDRKNISKSPKKATRLRDSYIESVSASQSQLPDLPPMLARDDPLLDDDWMETINLESDTDYGGRQSSPPPSTRLEIVIEDSQSENSDLG